MANTSKITTENAMQFVLDKIMKTPTHPELCEKCKPLVESSNLEWVEVGGMNIGLHRQPLTWVLRDKYSDDVINMYAKYSQQAADKSRELAAVTEQRDRLAEALENCREDSIELLDERDWWQLENRGDYQQRYQSTRDNVTHADAALQSLIKP